MNHCLETGGEHVAPPHFRLMMACERCRTSAHFMLISSPHHKHTCREGAEICTECAKDCERLDWMEDCVAACRACAESCSATAPSAAMKSQRIAEEGRGETLIVVLDDGEEAFSALQEFAWKEGVSATRSRRSTLSRARSSVGSKSYKEIAVDEQCEVLNAIGDVAIGDDGRASLHVHIVLGLSDGSTRGGHLLKGTVQPTLEVVLTETS
jgi:hypothetical protein